MRCLTFTECFNADHPFLYAIVSTEKSNDVAYFVGRFAKSD